MICSSLKIRGTAVGTEAIMLGVITSIGGFLFGYDTVCFEILPAWRNIF